MKDFWVECLSCTHTWVAQFSEQFGLLFAADDLGDECPECGSHYTEVGDEFVH